MPPPALRRSRLIAVLHGVASRSVAFVLGPGGAGKSVLAAQLSDSAPEDTEVQLIAAHELGEAASILSASPQGSLTIIDQVEQLSDPAARALAAKIDQLPTSHRLILLGRRVPAPLRDRLRAPASLVIDRQDLHFDRDELTELALQYGLEPVPALIDGVEGVAAGWPAATSRLFRRLSRSSHWQRELAIFDGAPNEFTDLVEHYASQLTSDELEQLAALCSLGRFDETLAEQIGGPEFLARLEQVGVPLLEVGGWLALPGLLQRVHGALGPQVHGASVNAHLVARGEAVAVLRMLVDHGELAQAVEVFVDLTPAQLAALDEDELAVLILLMEPAMREQPEALLRCGRLALRSGNPELVRGPLERAVDHLNEIDPGRDLDVHHGVLAELAFLEHQVGNPEESERLIDLAAGDDLPALSLAVQARILDVRGGHLSLSKDPEQVAAAIPLLTESIALWRELGDHTRAGATTRMLGIGVLLEIGRYSEAIALFENQLRSGNCRAYDRGWAQLHLGRALCFVGRTIDAEAALAAADQLGEALDLVMLKAFGAWHRALVAAIKLDAQAVKELADEAGELLTPLLKTPAGAMFARDMADAFARCGLHEPAVEMARTAREVDPATDAEVDRVDASIEARFGDPSRALEMVAALEAGEIAQPWHAWMLSAYAAIAHRRLDNDQEATRRASEALHRAGAYGQPSLPLILEPHLFEGADEPPTQSPVPETGGLELTTLGGFEAQVHGRDVQVSSGRPGILLQFLAVNNSMASIDQVIDVLWGDIDLETGKKRLRNVLQRARAVCGDAVERRGDVLRLANWVGIDLDRAVGAARQVLALAEAPVDACEEALRLLEEPLLPERQYDEWVGRAQQEVDQLRLRLLDRKIEICLAEHRIESAIAAMEQAVRLDPYDLTRLDGATNILLDLGRSSSANSLRSIAQPA